MEFIFYIYVENNLRRHTHTHAILILPIPRPFALWKIVLRYHRVSLSRLTATSGGYLLLLVFALPGIGVFSSGIRDLNQAKASVDWPTSPGKVLSSSVKHERDSDGDTYHAEVVYEFKVNNTTYSSKRIAYGDYGSSNPSHAQKIVNQYPQDKNVTVHYMPNNPKVCVIEVGVKGKVSSSLQFIGIYFVIFGLIICIVGIVKK